MRRKSILILCSLNALVALTVLAICLPKLLAKPTQPSVTLPTADEHTLTDSERWEKALTSTNEREAAYYLSQIKDPAYKQSQLQAALRKLKDSASPDTITLNDLRRNAKLITAAGQLAQAPDDLDLLIALFKKQTLQITLREAALRSCIEASVRLDKEGDSEQKLEDERRAIIAQCCDLIDQAYIEQQTSLSGLALQADWFLEQNDMLSDTRRSSFEQHLKATLSDPNTLQSNRLDCLNILKAPANDDLVDNDSLFELYQTSSSEALKEAILTLLAAKKGPSTEAWLRQQTASSPKLEQLQLTAIEAFNMNPEPLNLKGN